MRIYLWDQVLHWEEGSTPKLTEYTTYFVEEVGFLPGGIRINPNRQGDEQKKTPGEGVEGEGQLTLGSISVICASLGV